MTAILARLTNAPPGTVRLRLPVVQLVRAKMAIPARWTDALQENVSCIIERLALAAPLTPLAVGMAAPGMAESGLLHRSAGVASPLTAGVFAGLTPAGKPSKWGGYGTTMALGADNGVQTWRYDAIRQRTWNWVSCNVVLRRSADLVWIEFTAHPSRFCSDVLAVQSIEAFLSGGAPVEAPVDVVASIRDHLLSLRRPGPSTWLEIAVELQGNDACLLVRACLRQNGESLENVPFSGRVKNCLAGRHSSCIPFCRRADGPAARRNAQAGQAVSEVLLGVWPECEVAFQGRAGR